MIFQILATAFLLAAVPLVLLRPFSVYLLKIGLLTILVLAVYFVWRPDDLTGLANAVGIGRGADLVSYVSTLTLLLVILATSARARQVDRQVTLLCRHIAIAEARRPHSGENGS